MDTEQIKERLTELFSEHRIIFWNDANVEFEDFVSELSMDGIEILRPDKIGQLKTKVLIEIDKPEQKFVVYAPLSEPRFEDDWLLDIRLYSYPFHADRSSMIVEELGLQHHFLREHIGKRIKFFNNKERLERLKKRIASSDLEIDIDRKMIATLVKSEGDSFFEIVNTLFSAFSDDIAKSPECWEDIVKFDLEGVFWNFANDMFGYKDESPSPQKLLCCLFVTDLYTKVGEDIGDGLKQFLLPVSKQSNAVVCLDGWRDSVRLAEKYDHVACLVEKYLDIEKHISNVLHDALMSAVTFIAVEKACSRYIKETLLAEDDPFNAETIREYARRRQDMYWANRRMKDTLDAPREVLFNVYDAIIQATEIIELKKAYITGFSFDTAKVAFERYTQELYKFDRAYRCFCESVRIVDAKGFDILKDLENRIEDIYTNSFLEPLALAWEKVANLSSWHIDGILNQYDFWGRYPKIEMGDGKATVYVVISDAFRYESATELAEQINGKYRFSARLNTMLGCVPSYTAIGMAALLPHARIDISDKGDVILDGKSCASTQQRSQILEQYKGLAINSKELMEFSRDEARNFVRDRNVVYVYHDTIDATGDDAKTEKNTFPAVRKTLDELDAIVSRLINDLNAHYAYVTADHGFVYKEQKPDDIDRYKIAEKPNTVKTNKRYMLGEYIPEIYDARHGIMSNTCGVDKQNDMSFLVPKGMSLFYFTGGARFFHGGMSLQEVVVPVVTVKEVRDKEKVKTVNIQVIGTDQRITTGKHRFQFLQVNAVSDGVKSLTAKIGIYDGTTAVSDIHTVTFENASDDMSQRMKDIIFTLQNVTFDRKKIYKLILRDVETDREILSSDVHIDRTFTEDF